MFAPISYLVKFCLKLSFFPLKALKPRSKPYHFTKTIYLDDRLLSMESSFYNNVKFYVFMVLNGCILARYIMNDCSLSVRLNPFQIFRTISDFFFQIKQVNNFLHDYSE